MEFDLSSTFNLVSLRASKDDRHAVVLTLGENVWKLEAGTFSAAPATQMRLVTGP